MTGIFDAFLADVTNDCINGQQGEMDWTNTNAIREQAHDDLIRGIEGIGGQVIRLAEPVEPTEHAVAGDLVRETIGRRITFTFHLYTGFDIPVDGIIESLILGATTTSVVVRDGGIYALANTARVELGGRS